MYTFTFYIALILVKNVLHKQIIFCDYCNNDDDMKYVHNIIKMLYVHGALKCKMFEVSINGMVNLLYY